MKTLFIATVLLMSSNLFANCEKLKSVLPQEATFKISTFNGNLDINIDTMAGYFIESNLAKKNTFTCVTKGNKVYIQTIGVGDARLGIGWFYVNRHMNQILSMVFDKNTKVLTFNFADNLPPVGLNTSTNELLFNNAKTSGRVVYWKGAFEAWNK